MTQTEKDNINKRTENRHLLRRIRAGFAAAKATPYKGLLLALYLAGAALVWLFRGHLFSLDTYGMFSPVLGAVINLLIPLYGGGGLLSVLVLLGTPWGAGRQRRTCKKQALPTIEMINPNPSPTWRTAFGLS